MAEATFQTAQPGGKTPLGAVRDEQPVMGEVLIMVYGWEDGAAEVRLSVPDDIRADEAQRRRFAAHAKAELDRAFGSTGLA